MVSNRRASDRSDVQPLNSPTSPFEDVDTAYNSGDLGMQHQETSPYSPPLATPNSVKSGYTYLNTPTSTFDMDHNSDKESLMGDSTHHGHHGHHHHHHVKRFDHNETRKILLKTGGSKLLVTVVFSALTCVCLRAWEGFAGPIVLSKIDVRIFNALMLGLSLCLGLNLLSSLKHYANTFRWSFLAQRYMSLETFDLVLHAASLVKITKLMVVSMPGIRGRKILRKVPWFRDARDDGTKWMWLVCMLWLNINIGSQILVALLSLFWPVENSAIPLMSRGSVTVANLNAWYNETEPDANATSLEAAWTFGMEAMTYPEFLSNETQTDMSSLPGAPLYKGNGFWEYRFLNRDPAHQYTNYVVSGRKIQAITTCETLEVRGGVVDDDEKIKEFGSMYIEGKPTKGEWTKYEIPEQSGGAVTWIASVNAHCGPRCTNFTVLQDKDDDLVKIPGLFLCNSTLTEVTKTVSKYDITPLKKEDEDAIYSSDDFARVAAGAIGWTGIAWNNWTEKQTRSYSQGSKWSPKKIVTNDDVEKILMRFTVGAIAAFDDHGIRYEVENQNTRPLQGQQLDVDWFWILIILCGICGIQLLALVLLVVFANRTIVRDESFLSMAMLLSPVVARIGRSGMNLSGDEIKEHPKLKWKKIRYDYREGKNGDPNQVDIFFEGRDQKEGRKSWAAGSYS